ncbi:MAG: CPBP family intramembrane metalloprotease [Chloroflexota bacterium]|nr:CPBP family intramembrane metalloprotease [Chloroflexota bacterium]
MSVAPTVDDHARPYPWRQFAILAVAGWLGALAVIPYELALLPGAPHAPPLALLVLSGALNGAVEMAVAAGVGLLAARAVGLRAPVSEALASGGDVGAAVRGLRPWLAAALGGGASLLIVALDATVFRSVGRAMAANGVPTPARAVGLLASFEGGITEEILLRLLVMSVLVWLLTRIWRPTAAVFWAANIAAAVLFGLGHLPATAALVAITPFVVTRAVVLNGVLGVVAGWLYWRRGLESAMIAHFTGDLVLHVVLGG